jgi:hypothetical protein
MTLKNPTSTPALPQSTPAGTKMLSMFLVSVPFVVSALLGTTPTIGKTLENPHIGAALGKNW